jgi:hypothetical protein
MRVSSIVLLFLTVSCFSFAQLTSQSPFSSYGFGEKGGVDHATFTGIGNNSLTYFDSTVLNMYNPSTYNTLGKGQPLFSLGLTSRLSFYEENGNERFASTAFIEHFVMAFTLKKHFGLAFGLKPFARKGYSIEERVAVGTDSLKYSYLGTGGPNQVFLGLSTNLLKMKGTTLSVGGNFSYLFGSCTNERRSQLIALNNLPGGVDWNTLRFNSLHYELGAYFQQLLSNKHTFTLTGVIEPNQDLQVKKDEYLFYGKLGNPEAYDTLFAAPDQVGSISLPTTVSIGFSYKFWFNDARANNSLRNSELSIHAGYSTTDWTSFSTSFDGDQGLNASSRLTLGVQYIPERQFYDNQTSSSFLEKVRYRAGYYQTQLPYSLNGAQISDQGITLGFGIPILAQRSLSSVNFGFSAGKRGTGVAGTFSEQYIGINFGVILAPSNFDRWFVKRKLD